MDEPKTKGVVVKYTADKMRAVVALSKNSGQVTLGLILRELIHKGVVHGLDTDIINRLAANPVYDKYVEVAKGTPAAPGVDGRIVILAEDPAAEAKQIREFAVVRAGEPVARRVPPKPGQDGINVLGDAIPALPVKDAELKFGCGTAISPNDPNLLVAVLDGVLEPALDGAIEVLPHIEIAGDVDATSGDVEFEGHVTVCGAVRSGFSVLAGGSLVVMGEVENARIVCGGDLFLHSVVRGGSKAEIVCGGSVHAAQIENVKISASGGVTVVGDITEAEISCKGAVKAASISGGSVAAVCGISAERVGSESETHTVLDVGGIHQYVKERDGLKGSMETQNLLTEGYVSELFGFVRDSMDEFGIIPDEKLAKYDAFAKNLTDSLAVIRGYEESIGNIEALLKDAEDCSISAGEMYPNVFVKLGFSEQGIKEVLRNVNLKPVGA